MRPLLYIALFLLAGCNAFGDFPARFTADAGAETDDAAIDSGPEDSGRDLGADDDFGQLRCGEPIVPAEPELPLVTLNGGPLDAFDSRRRIALETARHGDHIDHWIGFLEGETPRLHLLHGTKSIEQKPQDFESDLQGQQLTLWRSNAGVHLSLLMSSCVGQPDMLHARFTTYDSADAEGLSTGMPKPCFDGLSRVTLPGFSGGLNRFTARDEHELYWLWSDDGLGLSSTRNPGDAFEPDSTWQRHPANVYADPRSEAYSTGGRLHFWIAQFDEDLLIRWLDPRTGETDVLDIDTYGSLFSVVHLADEVYLTAHRENLSNELEFRLYEYDVFEAKLVRVDAAAHVIFEDTEPTRLDLAVFEGGAILVDWREDTAGDLLRVTPLSIELGTTPSVREEPGWTWRSTDRIIVETEARAMRDGCDLVVSIATLFGIEPEYKADHMVYRYENYFPEPR